MKSLTIKMDVGILHLKNSLKKHFIKAFFFIGILFCQFAVFGQQHLYWIGPLSAGGDVFTNPNNWSTSPTGGTTSGVAPGDYDIVHFRHATNPITGTPIQTSVNFNSGDCGEVIVDVSSPTIYQFRGDIEVRGSFTANNNARFINIAGGYDVKFSGVGSLMSIDLGTAPLNNALNSSVRFLFDGSVASVISDYELKSDFPIQNAQIIIKNSSINYGGNNITSGYTSIEDSSFPKTINFSNSNVTFTASVTGFFGVLQFTANVANTTYNFNGATLNCSSFSNNNIAFVATQAENTSLTGINEINFSNGDGGIHTRAVNKCLIEATRLNINVPYFSTIKSQNGGIANARCIIRVEELNLNVPTVINQTAQLLEIDVETINTIGICNQMHIIKSTTSKPLRLNIQNPITTNRIAFQGVHFNNSTNTFTATSTNDLGLNFGQVAWTGAISGATLSWTGATSNNWNIGANWSTGCVPTLIDDVVINSGPNPVLAGSAGLCRNLTLSSGSAITGGGELYINGDANLTGYSGLNVATIYFVGSGTRVFTPGVATLNSNINFTSVGTYSISSDLVMTSTTRKIFHLVGNLNVLNRNIEAAAFVSTSSILDSINSRNLNITGTEFNLNSSTTNGQLGATWYLNLGNLQSFTSTNSRINLGSASAHFNTEGISSFSPVEYNVIEFTNPVGTANIYEGLSTVGTHIIDSLIFRSNASFDKNSTDANGTNIVNDYFFTSGKTYEFTTGSGGRTYRVRDSLNVDSGVCGDFIFIKSDVPGTRFNLRKQVIGPFGIQSAIVSDINAIGTLTVTDGIDNGNNNNVVVNLGTPGREMFWRPDALTLLGTGDWNDGTHWAIIPTGYPVSPIDPLNAPSISNVGECIPRPIDNVYFDDLSFNGISQSVDIDDIEAYCKNMLWDGNAGTRAPRLLGTSVLNSKLNVFGSLEMQNGVNPSNFNASILMSGRSQTVDAQNILIGNLITFPRTAIGFVDTGRYDLRSNISFFGPTNTLTFLKASVEQKRGYLFTNGFNINAAFILLNVNTPNTADISNSTITSRGYTAIHNSITNFSAINSDLILLPNGDYLVDVNYAATDTLKYCRIFHQQLAGATNSMSIRSGLVPRFVNFEKVEFETSNTLLNGSFRMDTLIYAISSDNKLTPRIGAVAHKYIIVDSLRAIGDPCRPIRITSSNNSQAAGILYENCNPTNYIEVRDGYLEDIVGLPTCGDSNYRLTGTFVDLNNWRVRNTAGTLPVSAAISCDLFPALLDASSFSPSWQYTWSTGETSDSIRVSTPGTYTLDMYYDPTCFINQAIIITDYDSIPPVVTCPSDSSLFTDIDVCSFRVTNTDFDAVVTDNCGIDSTWVRLTGATILDTTTATLQGVRFNRGVTTVTWFANDFGDPVNVSSCSFQVTVVDSQVPEFTTLCPANNYVYPNTVGSCSANVSWTPPAGDDNCSALLTTSHPIGTLVLVGDTLTITYTLTDLSGNTATCSFNMAVIDTQDPTITPPTNITVNTDAVDCNASSVVLGTPVTADNCGVATVTNNAPADFPLGSTTVTWTVTDIHGNDATATQTVTVVDNVNPTINCPILPDSTGVDLGACSYEHIGTAWDASSSDNCAVNTTTYVLTGATTGSGTTLSGVTFNQGTTTVRWTVTDNAGNTAQCVNTVIIFDGEAPVITSCPTNLVTSTNIVCTYVHTGTALDPVASDNCTTLTAVYTLTGATTGTGSSLNGVVFNIGTTTVSWAVTDGSGNQVNTCFFDVIVEDNTDPVITVCPTNSVVSADVNVCDYTHSGTSWNPIATDNCDTALDFNYVLTGATTGSGTTLNGQVFNLGVTNVVWTITDDDANDILCSFTVTVEDNQNPVFAGCPSNISVNMSGATCSEVVNWTAPVASDNCPGVVVTNSHNPGDVFPVGLTAVTYTATDAAGNTTTCTFNVTVVDLLDPVINNCPSNISSSSDAGICGAVATWPVVTATDNCAVTSFTSTHNSGDVFPIGTTTVTYTAIDTYGNDATCTFTVTITDNESPVFTTTCPSDNLAYPNDAGDCSAIVNWTPPVGSDNCSFAMTSTHNPGVVFNVGTTTLITYTLTDPAGNTATCSFNIGVIDNEDPIITSCPTNSVVSSNPNVCDYTHTGIAWNPIATDNCATILTMNYALTGATVATGNTSLHGQVFNVGVTNVEWTITDNNGNTLTCDFTVTVEDNQNPVFAGCPSNISVNMSGATCSEVVNWTAPVASDNCPGVVVTNSHNPGDVFPVGITTVTYTATDAAGNTAICTFNVTVVDLLDPVFDNCPANITITNDAGICGAVATWVPVTATDNCTVNSLASTHNSGAVFPVGTTTVVYTATDTYGNDATCTFTVTVTDNENPVITNVPASINACENEQLVWTVPTATDNCAIASFVSTSQVNDVFPVGTTTVTYIATDIHGNVATATFDVIVNPLPTISIEEQSGKTTVCLGEDINLNVNPVDLNLTYEWFDNFNNSIGSGTAYTVNSGAIAGSNTFYAVATDIYGCQSTDQLEVIVQPCGITITEAVTPNGDGFNDVFIIENVEFFPGTKVKFFNRWGLEVYSNDDYQNDWDARSRSSLDAGGDYLPEGTYYYLIELGGDANDPDYGKMFKGYFFIKLNSN